MRGRGRGSGRGPPQAARRSVQRVACGDAGARARAGWVAWLLPAQSVHDASYTHVRVLALAQLMAASGGAAARDAFLIRQQRLMEASKGVDTQRAVFRVSATIAGGGAVWRVWTGRVCKAVR